MKIVTLKNTPQLATALELQKDLSLASNGAELTYAFARHFGSLTGVSFILGLQVQDLAPGEYRLMDWIDFFQEDLTLESIQRNSHRESPLESIPIQKSQVVSRLIENNTPSLAENINPHDDETLSEIIQSPMDCISLPIYFNGVITEWVLACRKPGIPLQTIEVRTGLSNMNMLARQHSLLRLSNEIKQLNNRLDQQVQEVGIIQRGILPQHAPIVPGLSIAFHYEPCEAAGGDYFDFHRFTEDLLGVVIADVSGHGPGAAVVMAMLRTAISMYRLFERSPEKVVEEINKIMRDGLRNGNFVTAVFLSINIKTGEVHYANAGHPHPRLRRSDGRIKAIDHAVCPPLGIIDELDIREGKFLMQPGDLLFLYTDGLSEAFSPSRKQFGLDQLDTVLQKNCKTPEESLNMLSTELHKHVGQKQISDDLCMVAIRFDGEALCQEC